MKPKPFASLNHFTVPVAMTETFLRGTAPCCSRRDGGVIRRQGGQTKTPRELDLARRVAQTSKHATEAAQNDWQYDKSRWHRQPDSCPRGGSRPPWSCGSQMLAGEINGVVGMDGQVTTPAVEAA